MENGKFSTTVVESHLRKPAEDLLGMPRRLDKLSKPELVHLVELYALDLRKLLDEFDHYFAERLLANDIDASDVLADFRR